MSLPDWFPDFLVMPSVALACGYTFFWPLVWMIRKDNEFVKGMSLIYIVYITFYLCDVFNSNLIMRPFDFGVPTSKYYHKYFTVQPTILETTAGRSILFQAAVKNEQEYQYYAKANYYMEGIVAEREYKRYHQEQLERGFVNMDRMIYWDNWTYWDKPK